MSECHEALRWDYHIFQVFVSRGAAIAVYTGIRDTAARESAATQPLDPMRNKPPPFHQENNDKVTPMKRIRTKMDILTLPQCVLNVDTNNNNQDT